MTMTLSKNHKVVIKEFRKGTAFYFNAVTSYHPYSQGGFGDSAKMIHGTIMRKLESLGLITKAKINIAIYQYELTELGKTIEI